MANAYGKRNVDLITEWATAHLKPGQFYSKTQIVDWFMAAYPKLQSRSSIATDVEAMCVNSTSRHHYSARPGSGHDLFYKESAKQIRLWEPDHDPAPRYKTKNGAGTNDVTLEIEDSEVSEVDSDQSGMMDVLEKDLQNFLVRNLHLLEPRLRLYEADGRPGIEFNAGGRRRIDILAVDAEGGFVVVELKVVRGYDKVIGQLQRYMAWVERELAGEKAVRGIIVAPEIDEDLRLATSFIADRVKLLEYSLSFQIQEKQR